MSCPVPALADRARVCAERIREAEHVVVVSHIDADGIMSAGITVTAVERAEIGVDVVFAKQLDREVIASVASHGVDTVVFTDFGSGQLSIIQEFVEAGAFSPVVVDHHQPADVEFECHLNPLLEGINGASELSGAGASFILASELGVAFEDLAGLAVIGAVGDMQASSGGLQGANEAIVEVGVEAGVIETGKDLSLYGKQTRPLPKLIEYASELSIPGISNNESGSVRFLEEIGVELQVEGEWRTWADLDRDERQTVVSALVRRAVERGVAPGKINGIVGTSYELAMETEGTEMRDASEFSTLLNATARYDRPDVGLAVAMGDRSEAYDRARRLLTNHRRRLSEGIEFVQRNGVTRAGSVQWFDAGDSIRETIVGIVAGMAMGVDGVDASRPIIAFAAADDGVKVSARGTQSLVRRGLDLSVVMREAAEAVGGEGGGHDIAAGATIPEGAEEKFIGVVDSTVAAQLGIDAEVSGEQG